MVRNIFKLARTHAPSILFIDEVNIQLYKYMFFLQMFLLQVDAIATKRSDHAQTSDRETQRVLMELLVQMDGFDQHTNVIVIMATNRADTLDPALLRPGLL